MSAAETIDYGKSFSLESILDQAKWFRDDLEKGGWKIIKKSGGATFWMKTFANDKIPIKVLYECHVGVSAEHFVEAMNPKNVKMRQKWDNTFLDNQVLQEYPEVDGYLLYNVTKTRWPLSNRDVVLFTTAAKRIDWYGKQGYLIPYINAEHKSKPANEARCVRAENGGQFLIVIPDENDPDNACTVFGLSHNLYNGWLPSKRIEFLLARAVPPAFINLYNDLVEGYKLCFGDKE